MILKWNVTIPELTGTETRRAYIYLPNSYHDNSGKRYPVLYMFDGHNLFYDSDATYGKSWGLKEYMDATDTPLIIAAIECNHSPDNGRLREYAPFSFTDPNFGFIKGLGRTTMRWMINTFKKEIDQNFRTLPDRKHTYIGGSSMGGLMSLYAVTHYNHIFSKAAALSPSIWFAPEKLQSMIKRGKMRPDTVIYMDYGEKELPSHPTMRKMFSSVSTLLFKRKVLLTTRIVPNGTHSEASWEKQIPYFMSTLLYDEE